MKLRRRMAQQAKIPHRLPKRPTEVEQRMADTAVDMLVLIQMLPYILCDIQEELETAGQYRHTIKRRFLQAEGVVFDVAEPAYRIFARYDPETAKGFRPGGSTLPPHKRRPQTARYRGCSLTSRRNMSADRTLQPPTRTDLLFRTCGPALQNSADARLHPRRTARNHRTDSGNPTNQQTTMKPFVALIFHLWAAMERSQEILRKSQPYKQIDDTPENITPNIKDILANLSKLTGAIRAAAITIQDLKDAMRILRGQPCYYPPLRPRLRPKPRRSRARHWPTRLQRRRGRQAKRKTRK